MMKRRLYYALLLGVTLMTAGCAGVPGQAMQDTGSETAARATFIAERGGAAQDDNRVMMGGGIVGTIAAIEDGMITVTTPDGKESKIVLADGGAIVQQSTVDRSELTIGQEVTAMVADGVALMLQSGGATPQMSVAGGGGAMMLQSAGDSTGDPTPIRSVVGTVQTIEEDTLTILPADGGAEVTISLTAQTMMEKRETVEFATLEVGMTIAALGETDGNGIVQAAEITILTAGMAPITIPAAP